MDTNQLKDSEVSKKEVSDSTTKLKIVDGKKSIMGIISEGVGILTEGIGDNFGKGFGKITESLGGISGKFTDFTGFGKKDKPTQKPEPTKSGDMKNINSPNIVSINSSMKTPTLDKDSNQANDKIKSNKVFKEVNESVTMHSDNQAKKNEDNSVNISINTSTVRINNKNEFEKIPLSDAPPYDSRFPNQNQTRNCYQNYLDYHRCKKVKGEDHEPCNYYKKQYNMLCPNVWIEKWDDQIERDVFPGRI